MVKQQLLGSRAVERPINPGNDADCPVCEQPVKFVARKHLRQVICNVYEGDKWNRVETYHQTCYQASGEPHGPILDL